MARFDRERTPRVIAVASGAPGVGKTTLVANLGLALAGQGIAVAVCDADFHRGGLAAALGIEPGRELAELIGPVTGDLDGLTLAGPGHLPVIAARPRPSDLAVTERLRLLGVLEAVGRPYEVVLLDLAAGPTDDVLFFGAAASDVVIVTTPDVADVDQAAVLVRRLAAAWGRHDLLVVLNRVRQPGQCEGVLRSLATAVRDLAPRLDLLGSIPDDEAVGATARLGRPLLVEAPRCSARSALLRIAHRLLGTHPAPLGGGIRFFFDDLLTEGRP